MRGRQRFPSWACKSSEQANSTTSTIEAAFTAPAEPAETSSSPAAAETDTMKLRLKAETLARDLLLEVFSDGSIGQQVIVVGVMEGSDADKAGVIPGMKLLSISDSVRTDVTWPLGSRPSLRFVKDTVAAIAAGKDKEIQLEFTSKPVLSSAPRNAEINQVSQRINRRQERMDIDEQRNDSKVLGAAVGLFIFPAIIILAIAYFSGYLDHMYQNSLISRS